MASLEGNLVRAESVKVEGSGFLGFWVTDRDPLWGFRILDRGISFRGASVMIVARRGWILLEVGSGDKRDRVPLSFRAWRNPRCSGGEMVRGVGYSGFE